MTAENAAALPADRPASRVSIREAAVIVGLFLLAAVARLAQPGLTEFKADEARLLTAALETSEGSFALHGISSSVGFPNAPMSVWLYALPLVIWRHPYAATFFTGILGVLAVAGVYWLARRYWGVAAATAAGLMLAVSPWAIVFSRKIWAQDLLPIFAVGWAIGAGLAFVEGRRPFIVLHLVCLGIAVQIHPAAIGLIPATLLFLVVFHKRVDWRMFALGGVLAALTAAPFLWYLWRRWQTEGRLPFATGQSTAEITFDSLRLTLEIALGDGLHPLAAASYGGLPGEQVARLIWLAMIIAGALWTAVSALRRWERAEARMGFICLAWFLIPAFTFIWHRTPVYVHYFIVALPAPYLMTGAFFGEAARAMGTKTRALAWMAFVAVAALHLAAWGSLMIDVNRQPAAGGFGIPLSVKLAAADGAREMRRATGAAEVLLVGNGSDPEQDDFPAEFRALLHGVPVRYVDLNTEALFPATAAVALLDTIAADTLTSTREFYAALPGEERSFGVDGAEAYTIHALPPSAAPPADVALSQPALLANFVHLTGHNALRLGSAGALWDVYWRPADNPDPADYHIFNHLIDETGGRIAQADGSAFVGAQWRPGDVAISRFLLPLSDEPRPPLTMRVGMYRFPSLENVPVLDEAANPTADAVEFPITQ